MILLFFFIYGKNESDEGMRRKENFMQVIFFSFEIMKFCANSLGKLKNVLKNFKKKKIDIAVRKLMNWINDAKQTLEKIQGDNLNLTKQVIHHRGNLKRRNSKGQSSHIFDQFYKYFFCHFSKLKPRNDPHMINLPIKSSNILFDIRKKLDSYF